MTSHRHYSGHEQLWPIREFQLSCNVSYELSRLMHTHSAKSWLWGKQMVKGANTHLLNGKKCSRHRRTSNYTHINVHHGFNFIKNNYLLHHRSRTQSLYLSLSFGEHIWQVLSSRPDCFEGRRQLLRPPVFSFFRLVWKKTVSHRARCAYWSLGFDVMLEYQDFNTTRCHWQGWY